MMAQNATARGTSASTLSQSTKLPETKDKRQTHKTTKQNKRKNFFFSRFNCGKIELNSAPELSVPPKHQENVFPRNQADDRHAGGAAPGWS